ncbi:MAG: hypothetical protein FJX76_02715 [Armatimonadetes bacterium]|nr:hypothetical protein [Armatimonadota bacterium]
MTIGSIASPVLAATNLTAPASCAPGGAPEQADVVSLTARHEPVEASQDKPSCEAMTTRDWKWGFKGHSMINSEAARELPEAMPQFFRNAGPSLAALASQPDRWKFRSLPLLSSVNRPDHWINSELLGERALPADRYQYLGMIVNDNLAQPNKAPGSVGFLPYQMAEMFEKLQAEMALYRREMHDNGSNTPLTRQLEQNIIYTAGILGHYVGDACQPLHVSVHGDGWDTTVEPNDEGFDTERGIHTRFESYFVNSAVNFDALQKKMQPARALEGQSMDLALNFINESRSHVRTLYRMDRDGKIDPRNPSQEGVDFTVDRMASGAQRLRDLWYTAWVRSERLAAEAQEPEWITADGDDGYNMSGYGI